jgi:hypothetical protein
MATRLDDRPPAAGDRVNEVTVRVVADGAGRSSRRRLPWVVSVVAVLLAAALACTAFVAAGVVTGLFHLSNPFATSTVDRSPPALLHQINDLSSYTAAQGRFSTTIDLERDVAILPSFIAGERTVFLAQGTVDAAVDFAALSADAVRTSGDGHVTIALPEPDLRTPVIDPAASHVAARDRGLVDRIAGVFSDNPTSERDLYLRARHKLARAARESRLVARAERNTTTMLQSFLGRLGYSDVEVVFTQHTAPSAQG